MQFWWPTSSTPAIEATGIAVEKSDFNSYPTRPRLRFIDPVSNCVVSPRRRCGRPNFSLDTMSAFSCCRDHGKCRRGPVGRWQKAHIGAGSCVGDNSVDQKTKADWAAAGTKTILDIDVYHDCARRGHIGTRDRRRRVQRLRRCCQCNAFIGSVEADHGLDQHPAL